MPHILKRASAPFSGHGALRKERAFPFQVTPRPEIGLSSIFQDSARSEIACLSFEKQR